MNSIPFINRSIYKFQSMMTFDSYLTFAMHFFCNLLSAMQNDKGS